MVKDGQERLQGENGLIVLALELVLDSNAALDRDLLAALNEHKVRAVLPAVAYAELGVFFESRGELHLLQSLLKPSGIEVEWFRANEAEQAARTGAAVGDFADNARDHLIAAHVTGQRMLVTHNNKDFTFLKQVLTPAQAVKRLRGKVE